MGLKNLEHALVVLIALELEPAGTKSRCRGIPQSTDILLRFLGKIDEIFLQNPKDTVHPAVNLLDTGVIQGFRNNPGNACVNNGGWTARLGDQAISNEFLCHS